MDRPINTRLSQTTSTDTHRMYWGSLDPYRSAMIENWFYLTTTPVMPQSMGLVASASAWEEKREYVNVFAASSIKIGVSALCCHLSEVSTMLVNVFNVHNNVLCLEKLSN